jgi:pimeloyl-ACP methyl ester carboxylesterase
MGPSSSILTATTLKRSAMGQNRKLEMPDLLFPGVRRSGSHYATAIEDRFEGAIHILGFSTGGSIAQQFAADRPDLVRRLVLAGTACRLGPVIRDAQRRHAQFAASGQYRRSLAALAPTLTGSALGQRLAGAAMWLAAQARRGRPVHVALFPRKAGEVGNARNLTPVSEMQAYIAYLWSRKMILVTFVVTLGRRSYCRVAL